MTTGTIDAVVVASHTRIELRVPTAPTRALTGIIVVIAGTVAAGAVRTWPRHLHHGVIRGALDFARDDHGTALLVGLTVGLVALTGATLRWAGARSLVAVIAGVGVIATFALPALLDGRDPTSVALVAGAAVIAISIALVRGVHVTSAAAFVGASLGLLLTAAVARASVAVLHLTGTDSFDPVLRLGGTRVDVAGLVLAGVVLGTIGALHDVAVSHVDAVVAERASASPPPSRRALLSDALASGRVHAAASMHAIAFAYVAAAMPLLLLFTDAGTSIERAARTDVVVIELVRALAGLIGLVATAPLAALVAACVLHRASVDVTRDDPRRYRSRHERQLWEAATAAEPVLPDRPDRAL